MTVTRAVVERPTFSEALKTWTRIALLSFGGPAGQISVMHRILVEEKRWISEERFLHALNYCMLLPGPEAQQLATYVGWLMHGARGGLAAGTLFILPGFIAIMLFSVVYVTWGQHPLMAGIFLGLKAAVVALVFQAVLRVGQHALRNTASRALAALAFIALVFFDIPFPLIVLAAAVSGFVWARSGAAGFGGTTLHGPVRGQPAMSAEPYELAPVTPSGQRAAKLLAIWLPLWLAPVGALALSLGPAHVLTQVGVFFSKMAVVTFGGAYAVLTYVAQQAVDHYAWVTPSQMLDGLGLAESTPGPLIMVVQFVGFLAGYQSPNAGEPLLIAILAACLTVWVTFVPCFLWIFLGAPYIESLRQRPALNGALAAITAAVVGVIANLGFWFTLHVLFKNVAPATLWGFVRVDAPELSSIQWQSLLLTCLALILTFALKWNIGRLLLTCTALGIGMTL
jgi:chromate transporter